MLFGKPKTEDYRGKQSNNKKKSYILGLMLEYR